MTTAIHYLIATKHIPLRQENLWWEKCKRDEIPYATAVLLKRSSRLKFDTYPTLYDFTDAGVKILNGMAEGMVWRHFKRSSTWFYGRDGLIVSCGPMTETEAGDFLDRVSKVFVTNRKPIR